MAAEPREALRLQLARQVAHWRAAADDLADLSQLASARAWASVDRYLGVALQSSLRDAVDRLKRKGDVLHAQLRAAEDEREMEALRREVLRFRRRYLAVEAMLDFYGDAVNTRTNDRIGAYLGACDFIAHRSLASLLEPLGKPIPRVLTYLDKGLGASILKAGLRLWDGRTTSPVAAIKVVRHNLFRPTALLHEAGHQVAHALGWVAQLSTAFEKGLQPSSIANLWAGWASEVAADAFAFVHTGYAALAALHDVIAGEPSSVMRVDVLDPHPAGYVRVLLGREMCKRFYGAGPWDDLARAWRTAYPPSQGAAGELLERSLPVLPKLVEIVLEQSYPAFGDRSLVDLIDPGRVRPDALRELARAGGPALYRSNDWIRRESLRLLALSGWRMATEPERVSDIIGQQKGWLQTLGEDAIAA